MINRNRMIVNCIVASLACSWTPDNAGGKRLNRSKNRT
ncbi:Uncharacterised protein [Leclercia adecarboxylata]|uniref:Lipoprotein n=1 Tax=Leclercia adecarboxylata TaxID=83655 RepID=A0A4U9HMB2_9ENTR|nr:Uncharacterised protein [Leclercia adecarboxylata]